MVSRHGDRAVGGAGGRFRHGLSANTLGGEGGGRGEGGGQWSRQASHEAILPAGVIMASGFSGARRPVIISSSDGNAGRLHDRPVNVKFSADLFTSSS